MADVSQELIGKVRERLRSLGHRTQHAIQQIGDEDLHWQPGPETDSIAKMALHMAGSLHRLAVNVGGAADTRDGEFTGRPDLDRSQLLATLASSFAGVDRVLSELDPERLLSPQMLHNRQVTVLDVLLGAATHAAAHAGQTTYIAKLRLGSQFRELPH